MTHVILLYTDGKEHKRKNYERMLDNLSSGIDELERLIQSRKADVQTIRKKLCIRYKILKEINTDLSEWNGSDGHISRKLIPINCWRVLPLEDMIEGREPSKDTRDRDDINRHVMPVWYEKNNIYIYDLERMQKFFKDLGLDIRVQEGEDEITIYINLYDISDLPLDTEKLELVNIGEIPENMQKMQEER